MIKCTWQIFTACEELLLTAYHIQPWWCHLDSFTSASSLSLPTANMHWYSFEAIITGLLEGSPVAIAITALIAFGLPVLLHFIFYRSAASPPRSNFLLLGPPGAGKTALQSLVRPLAPSPLCGRLTLRICSSRPKSRLVSRHPKPPIPPKRQRSRRSVFPPLFRLPPTVSAPSTTRR